MGLDRITLANFRNHQATRLDGTAQFNLLVGENGAGKTNVLEALSLLAPGRGLRRAALLNPAVHGSFAVSAVLDKAVTLGSGVRAERPGRRVVQVNGAEVPAVRPGRVAIRRLAHPGHGPAVCRKCGRAGGGFLGSSDCPVGEAETAKAHRG